MEIAMQKAVRESSHQNGSGKVRIWTIGHSNRSLEKSVDLLQEQKIETLVDVRSSSKERMKQWLPEHGINYTWLGKELEGLRRGRYKTQMRTKL